MKWASFATNPPSFTNTNFNPPVLTKVQKSGLRYEKRAQEYLRKLCNEAGGFTCLCNPWLMYSPVGSSSSTVFFCQPDCLFVSSDGSKITIIEIKLSHTGDSWKQIRQLYEPVLRKIYPAAAFAAVEVCKWFDPHTAFPETFYYAENVLLAETNRFGMHIYKPRGKTGA